MTKTLTEQWRDGDMKGGIYYCKTKSYGEKKLWFHHRVYGGMYVQTYGTEEMFPEEDIIDILAPVPSYDEYNELVQKIHILNEQNIKQYNELCEEIKKNNILKKKLEIATKALKEINKNYRFTVAQDVVYKALKEMEGVK